MGVNPVGEGETEDKRATGAKRRPQHFDIGVLNLGQALNDFMNKFKFK